MDEMELTSLLKKMAAAHSAELPDANAIWWRAQLLRKQQQKEKSERPLLFMQLLSAATCLSALAIVMVRFW
jgi:hypothetical protein